MGLPLQSISSKAAGVSVLPYTLASCADIVTATHSMLEVACAKFAQVASSWPNALLITEIQNLGIYL